MSANGLMFYEALKGLRGLFSSSGADISITQQQASTLLPSRDDEAIQLALDAALADQPQGFEHLARIQELRQALEIHQRTDWRKNIGSLKMTERFEQVMISETTTRTNPGDPVDPADPANQVLGQRRRGSTARKGQERIEKKFDRRQRDYEWTVEDPRIRHLILVSKLVQQSGLEEARKYLLAAGLIKEKSASDRIATTWEATSKGVFHSVASLQLSDEYDAVKQGIPPTANLDESIGQALAEKHLDMKEETARLKAAGLPKWFWGTIIVGGVVAIVGIVILFRI